MLIDKTERRISISAPDRMTVRGAAMSSPVAETPWGLEKIPHETAVMSRSINATRDTTGNFEKVFFA